MRDFILQQNNQKSQDTTLCKNKLSEQKYNLIKYGHSDRF